MLSAQCGQRVQAPTTARIAPASRLVARCSAEEQAPALTRRASLGLLAGAAALLSANSAEAAFGDGARVFGSKPTNATGFIPYSGEGYALLLPARWNPSKEREFEGAVLKYEDNGDSVNSVVVLSRPTDKSSIEQVGTPEAFLPEVNKLLGQQVFSGTTRSEGGFLPNKVSAASLLEAEKSQDSKGKTYYKYELLTRTADGNEGGRHHLITASVSNGNLYICRVQIGDKRWFKGASKEGKGIAASFVVA